MFFCVRGRGHGMGNWSVLAVFLGVRLQASLKQQVICLMKPLFQCVFCGWLLIVEMTHLFWLVPRQLYNCIYREKGFYKKT